MPEAFDRNFDIALQAGTEAENALLEMLTGTRIECKRDYEAWHTGNVFVEFKCRDKPSGLSTTKAAWWAFAVCGSDGKVVTWLLAPSWWLRLKGRDGRKFVRGGERDTPSGPPVSRGFLVAVAEFGNP